MRKVSDIRLQPVRKTRCSTTFGLQPRWELLPKVICRCLKVGSKLNTTMHCSRFFFLGLFLALLAPFAPAQSSQPVNPDPVLLQSMQQELNRAMSSLSKADPAPYFISYSANDEFGNVIIASNGGIVANIDRRERTADISVRVGAADLDNTPGEN